MKPFTTRNAEFDDNGQATKQVYVIDDAPS